MFDPRVDAIAVVKKLQAQIGQLMVEKASTDVLMDNMNAHIADLEARVEQPKQEGSATN